MGKIWWILLVAAIAFWLMLDKNADDFNYDSLSGLNVLVTGASSGIGEEIAYTYARHGANVVITARKEDRLKRISQRCRELSPNKAPIKYVVADMANLSEVKMVIEESVSSMGGLDHLILNHAVIPVTGLWANTQQNLTFHDRVMTVNYQSFVHLAAFAMPHLENSNGSLCVVGAILGRLPWAYSLSYTASKFALEGFFSSLRWEYKLRGINVSITHITLGRIATDAAAIFAKSHMHTQGVDEGWFDRAFPPSDAATAARAILKAVSLRWRELYFPPSQRLYMTSVLRVVCPELLENLHEFSMGIRY